MKYFLLTLILATFLGKSLAFAQVSEGDDAPDFKYISLDGDSLQLSDQLGKVVYIFFYGAGCPHCISNGPVTETEIYNNFQDNEDFVAIGLDTWNSSASSNQAFRNSTGISYPLYLRAQQSLIDYYGSSGAYDRSLVVGADGKVKYKGNGYVNSDYEDVVASIENELEMISTNIEDYNNHPDRIALEQNYPNPFNPETVITYSLPVNNVVKLQVYNALGQETSVLVDAVQTAGEHTVTWNAINQPSGIYYYRLQSGGIALTGKMMLIK